MTTEQIEQKKQLLAEKTKEIKALVNELVEAGALELSEEHLDKATGGIALDLWAMLTPINLDAWNF